MRYLFLLTILILSIPAMNAQQISIQEGGNDILSSDIKKFKIFGHDSQSFYVMEFSGTQYFLTKLDQHLNQVEKQNVKLYKGLKTFELESVVEFYGQIYLFVSFRRMNDVTLYYQKIDMNTLKPITELKTITTVENIGGTWADFHFALSREETKLMIACRVKPAVSGSQFNEYYVFGKDLNLVWTRKDSYQFKGQGPRDNVYLVDEVGNISVLSLLRRESLFSLLRDNRNLYAIYRYTSGGNEFHEYSITLGERYIRGIKIVGVNQNELICAGLYSETFKTGVKGTFLIHIDPEGRPAEPLLSKIDDATLSELAQFNEPMINNEELISYAISDIVLRKNGKIMLISEQILPQDYNTFNNLMVTCYNINGEVEWTRIIHKKQNFQIKAVQTAGIDMMDYRDFIRQTGYYFPSLDNCSSYALMAPVDKSGIILFFNDNIRNIDNQSKDIRALNQVKKSFLSSAAVDEFGNLAMTSLIPWKKKMLYPEPIRYYDTLGNVIIMPAFKNRFVTYYKIEADAIP